MKTYQYLTIVAAMVLTFGACSTDAPETLKPGGANGDNEKVEFVSSIGDELADLGTESLDGASAAETRVTTTSDGAISAWETTDKISISDGALMYTYQPKEGSISGANCSFQSKTSASFLTDGGEEERTFYAFYPADAVSGWNGTTVTTMIYTEQKYSENVQSSGVMGPYMVATATTTDGGANASFTFGHICSVIDVDLSTFDGGEVESVALYANSQVSVAGSMKFNVSTKAATISGSDGAGYSNSLQSEVVRVSEINAPQPIVRFYVLPVKQTAGFTITVRCADGKYYTKKSGTAVGNDELNNFITSQTGITSGTLCKPYYKKYNFGKKESARTQNWMAMIPGNIKFNHLSIPGAHDAATSSGTSGSTPAAKCQDYTIAEQLSKGCRALDLRPGFDKTDLTIYHGITSTGVTLDNALNAVKSFLIDNPTETVFILIHEEDTRAIGWGSGPHQTSWATRVWNCVNDYTDYIASYGWKGNLNPCRGKMVVIFRDNYTDGDGTADLGCGKVGWGSSFNDKSIMTGVGSNTANGTLRYQDEYETSSESTKLTNLTTMLTDHIAAMENNVNYTFVNNTNIASGTTSVANLAKKVNEAVLGSSTFTGHTGKFGIMMTDFLFSTSQKGDQMFELIHKQNYKYVYKKRSRCEMSSHSGTDTGVDISADEYANGGTVYVKHQGY